MKHSIFSQNQDMPIQWFEKFDKEAIKQAIIAHLKANPTDTLEHCKEYSKSDLNKFYGMEILNFYQVNSKNNKVSLVYTKNGKEYFKSID